MTIKERLKKNGIEFEQNSNMTSEKDYFNKYHTNPEMPRSNTSIKKNTDVPQSPLSKERVQNAKNNLQLNIASKVAPIQNNENIIFQKVKQKSDYFSLGRDIKNFVTSDFPEAIKNKFKANKLNKEYTADEQRLIDLYDNKLDTSKPYYGEHRGNLDLNNRKVKYNEDGSISTEKSITVNFIDEDGKQKAILLPTIINGEEVSEDEAIEHYKKTGEQLGIFDNVEEANKYANYLHLMQDKIYNDRENPNRLTKKEMQKQLDFLQFQREHDYTKLSMTELVELDKQILELQDEIKNTLDENDVKYLINAEKNEKNKLLLSSLAKTGTTSQRLATGIVNAGGDLFQKPKEFYDGYQVGDVSKVVASTAKSTVGNVYKGAKSAVTDAPAKAFGYTMAGVNGLMGKEETKQRWLDAVKQYDEDNEQNFNETFEKSNQNTIFGRTGQQAQEGIGQSASLALASFGGEFKLLGDALTFVQGYSGGMEDAYNTDGVKDWQAFVKGTGSGVVSYISENLFDNIGYGGTKVDDAIRDSFEKNIKNGITRFLVKTNYTGFGEGVEEVLEALGNSGVDALINFITEKVGSDGARLDALKHLDIEDLTASFLTAYVSAMATEGVRNRSDLTDNRTNQNIINNANISQVQTETLNTSSNLKQKEQNNELLQQSKQITQQENKTAQNETSQKTKLLEKQEQPTGTFEENVSTVFENSVEEKNQGLLSNRTIKDAGNRKTNSYQYENPDVKPYFEYMAENMLQDVDEVQSSIIKEKGKGTVYGRKTNWLTDFRKSTNNAYTFEEIRQGLNDIIHDEGRENNAVSKKLELYIDQNLANGYQKADGTTIEANADYLASIKEGFNGEYSAEANEKKSIQNDTKIFNNYDKQTTNRILSNDRNIIIENKEQLKKLVDEAFEKNTNKALHLGKLNENIIKKIRNNIKNFPQNKENFFNGKTYDLIINQSEIRHLTDNKNNLTIEDIEHFVDILPNIIIENDYVSYTQNNKHDGLRFKKLLEDGTYVSFVITSSKGTMKVQTIYMEKENYENKKRSSYLSNDGIKPSDKTSETNKSLASNNILSQNIENSQEINTNSTLSTKNEDTQAFEEETAKLNKAEPDGKVKKHLLTGLESDFINKNVKKEIAKVIKTPEGMYIPDSNAEEINRSQERISKLGLDNVYKNLMNKFESNSIMTQDDVADAEVLIQQYQYKGDVKKVMEVITSLATLGTQYGQAIQALSIINKATPAGQAMYFEKMANKMTQEQKNGKKIKISDETLNAILNSKNKTELENNKQKAIEELANQLPPTFWEQVDNWRFFSMLFNPSTHIRNTLGNLGMHELQWLKNGVNGGIQTVIKEFNPDFIATNTWRIPSKLERENVKSFVTENVETMNFENYGSKYSDIVKNQIEEMRRDFGKETSNQFVQFINKLSKINSNLLSKEDLTFIKWAYRDALTNYMYANNLTSENLKILENDDAKTRAEKTDRLNQAQEWAMNEALEATFHQMNAIANGLKKLTKTQGLKQLLDSNTPFLRTPLNIVKTGFEYSPVGLTTSTVTLVKNLTSDRKQSQTKLTNRQNALFEDLQNGKITEKNYNQKMQNLKETIAMEESKRLNKAINNLSKGITGTGLAMLGMALSSLGIIKSQSDDEEDEYLDKLGFTTNNSIKIGDINIPIDWVGAPVMPLLSGAMMHNYLKEAGSVGEKIIGSIEASLYGTINTVSELSMLDGLINNLKAFGDYGEETGDGIIAFLESSAFNYLSQFIPTLVSKINRVGDNIQRDTSSAKKGLPKQAEKFIKQTSSKVSTLTNMLPDGNPLKLDAKVDAFGNEINKDEQGITKLLISNLGDNEITRTVGRLLDAVAPMQLTHDNSNELTNNFMNLSNDTGKRSLLPINKNLDKSWEIKDTNNVTTTVNLSTDDFSKYNKEYRQTFSSMFNKLFNIAEYKKLSPEAKETIADKIYSYAKQKIKVDIAKENGINYEPYKQQNDMYYSIKAIEDVGGTAENYIDYIASTANMTTKAERMNFNNNHIYSTNKDLNEKIRNEIYRNDISTFTSVISGEDTKYDAIEQVTGKVSSSYLDYKQKVAEDYFKTEYDSKGKAIKGKEKKDKIMDFVKNSNLSEFESLMIYVDNGYKLEKTQRNTLRDYLDRNKNKIDESVYNSIINKLDKMK